MWVADLTTGQGRVLPTSGDRVASPVLSPDGRTLVYLEWRDRYHAAAVMRRALPRGEPVELLRTPDEVRDDLDVDFDAGRIAFSIAGQGIVELPLAGGAVEPRTKQGGDRSPRYSPDGRAIAFVRASSDSQDLFTWTRADDTTRRVQASINVGERFDWSPDGRTFVLESHDTGTMDLWTLPASGGSARRLTSDAAQERWPKWASDGAIYFQHERRLNRLRPGGAREVVELRSTLDAPASASVLVRGAHVLDIGSGTWRRNHDILIEQGTIVAVGPSGSLSARGAGITTIDGTGRYAIPGLIDAHTHYAPWMGPLMRRFGVAVMRDLGSNTGVDWILDERDFTRAGHLDGPVIVASGPIVNGSGGAHAGQVVTESIDTLRATVEWLASQGVDLIKVGSENDATTLRPVIETAHARGLPVWGHVGIASAQDAIAFRQDGVEHLRGLAWSTLPVNDRPVPVPRRLTGMRREAASWWERTPEQLRTLARDMVTQGVGLDPTMIVSRTFSAPGEDVPDAVRSVLPPRVWRDWERGDRELSASFFAEDTAAFVGARQKQVEFMQAYMQAGGRMLTGSDVGVAWVVPGWSLHQEMRHMVSLGMTPIEAIRGATIYGAEASRVADRFGSIEAGKSGDLLLLERDPLQDITATREISVVVARGRAIPATGADARPRSPAQ